MFGLFFRKSDVLIGTARKAAQQGELRKAWYLLHELEQTYGERFKVGPFIKRLEANMKEQGINIEKEQNEEISKFKLN